MNLLLSYLQWITKLAGIQDNLGISVNALDWDADRWDETQSTIDIDQVQINSCRLNADI